MVRVWKNVEYPLEKWNIFYKIKHGQKEDTGD